MPSKHASTSSYYPYEGMWNTFLYAFSIMFSLSHERQDEPEMLPLADLFNGAEATCCDDKIINVNLARGYWPFLKGSMYENRDNLNLECICIYAKRNIEVGEELIMSYGDLSPLCHADFRVFMQQRTTGQVSLAISYENEDMTHAYL
jgi:hypothetical protein